MQVDVGQSLRHTRDLRGTVGLLEGVLALFQKVVPETVSKPSKEELLIPK